MIMINSLLELAIGWFVTYKVVKIVGAKGNLAIIIKLVGVLLIIGGTVSFVHSIVHL